MRKLNVSDIQSLTPNEKQVIINLMNRLLKEFNVIKVILFGSKARGDHNDQSDIDLMVLVEESKTPESRELLSELQFETIMEQDAPLMTTMENYCNWINEENISLPLKDNIESEGVEIEI